MNLDAYYLSSLSPEDAGRKLESLLPTVRESPILSEVEFYGAADVIAEHVGLPTTPPTLSGTVSWHHGAVRAPLWGLGDPDPPIPEAEMDYPFVMAPKGALRLLVHKKEETFFEALGSVAHLAVGAPFCYVKPSETHRVSGALLAMPSHSFVGGLSNHQLQLTDNYAAYLKSLCGRFAFVCVCLYADDYADENLRSVYRRHGLTVVRGASITDRNSLRRMRRLLEMFDCMTSNAFGSHVVYAGAAGCRAFLTEHQFFDDKRVLWSKHPFYAERPNLLSNVLRVNDHRFLRQMWPWLYESEPPATANTAWANEMLGMANTRCPLEIARLLGWRYPFDGEQSRELFIKFAPLLGCKISDPCLHTAEVPLPERQTLLQRVLRLIATAGRALLDRVGLSPTR